jgi:hypothetical protein
MRRFTTITKNRAAQLAHKRAEKLSQERRTEIARMGGRAKAAKAQKRIDLTGLRFGRLIVLGFDKIVSALKRHRYWKVRCDCGTEKTVYNHNLISGDTESCGCLHRDLLSLPPGIGGRNKILRKYKDTASKKELLWTLTDVEFDELTCRPCYYCGMPPSNSTAGCKGMNGAFVYSGLDRSDSSQGYTSSNVVPSCWTCNWMKRHMSEEVFLFHIAKIITHHQTKQIKAATHAA